MVGLASQEEVWEWQLAVDEWLEDRQSLLTRLQEDASQVMFEVADLGAWQKELQVKRERHKAAEDKKAQRIAGMLKEQGVSSTILDRVAEIISEETDTAASASSQRKRRT